MPLPLRAMRPVTDPEGACRMRCVFLGSPAFLGRVDGETRCAFWAGEPVDHDFDPALLIGVDLACTPSAAAVKGDRVAGRAGR